MNVSLQRGETSVYQVVDLNLKPHTPWSVLLLAIRLLMYNKWADDGAVIGPWSNLPLEKTYNGHSKYEMPHVFRWTLYVITVTQSRQLAFLISMSSLDL